MQLVKRTYITVKNKSMNPKNFIRMYKTIFWQASAHVKRSILGKLLTKIFSPELYASFGTFWVQIGQVLDLQSFVKDL